MLMMSLIKLMLRLTGFQLSNMSHNVYVEKRKNISDGQSEKCSDQNASITKPS